MEIKLCTIGFAGKSAEEFFSLLAKARVRLLVDVRENRVGQLSGFAKFPDIAFFLERIAGIEYRHEPRFAPTPEIRIAYRDSHDWPQYEEAFLNLMRERSVPETVCANEFAAPCAFLCSEPTAEKCHRRLIVELLATKWRVEGHSVEIDHLSIPSARKPHSKRRRAAHDGTHPE